MKRRILRIGLYSAFAFFSYLAILLYTFPYNSLAPLLSETISDKTGLTITLNSVSPTFPLGVQVGEIKIQDKKSHHLYSIDAIHASIPMSGLFSMPPPISYKIQKKESSLWGEVSQKDKNNLTLSLKGHSTKLSELMDELDPIPFIKKIEGEVDIDAEVTMPLAAVRSQLHQVLDLLDNGTLSLKLTNLIITNGNLPVPGITKLLFSSVNIETKFNKGRLKIKSATVKGDIQGSVTGDIIIRNPLQTSRIDLRVRFKPNPKLQEKTSMLISLLSRKKGQDGFFNIDLKGTFQKIQPIL